ncbi:MAG: hypothetical protein EOO73_15280 [Myxococcales bacterium]|nr:MAG: hypothetical protein EOO73_15280 [Myxococcales bacterium]
MRAFTRALSLLFFVPLLTGCMQAGEQELDDQDPHQPGDAIGSFAVVGKLKDDSCGADNLSAPAKWSFNLKLSRKGSTLYWLNGREAITGEIDASGRFTFETRLEVPVSAPRGALKGCVMIRSDSASGALTSSDEELSGELAYAYSVAKGSDCSEYALGAEGQPLALPCALSYSLSGARSD